MPHYTCDQHFIFFDWSLSQPIPCLMQAKSWSGQRLWDQVGGTSAFPTGLPVPLIPWLMQVRSWGVDPMDCLRYSSCPSASEIGNISIFNWSLCANQFPIPSPTQTRTWSQIVIHTNCSHIDAPPTSPWMVSLVRLLSCIRHAIDWQRETIWRCECAAKLHLVTGIAKCWEQLWW